MSVDVAAYEIRRLRTWLGRVIRDVQRNGGEITGSKTPREDLKGDICAITSRNQRPASANQLPRNASGSVSVTQDGGTKRETNGFKSVRYRREIASKTPK